MFSRLSTAIVFLALSLAACSTRAAPLREGQIVDIVWQALEANTSTRNQAAWEVITMQSVTGQEVRDLFEGEPVPGSCAPGPPPPDNAAISNDSSYWYLQLKPRPATPKPVPSEQYSPTAPPNVPEPFVKQAHFLVDPITGQIIARKLFCIIY